jgi:uncharacterized protein (DUF1697 family)
MAGTDRWRGRVLSTFEAPRGGAPSARETGMTRGKEGAFAKSTGAGSWVALLRGVNVGGKNRIAMKALAGYFEAAGCSEVRTVGASGNVLFRATTAVARAAPGLVEARIHEECGFQAPVVLRSGEDIAAVLAGNPFLAEGVSEELLHVIFLADRPAAGAALEAARSPGDRFALRGREVYLALPRGVSGSKWTSAYVDRVFGTVGTWRNWRTVGKLGGG